MVASSKQNDLTFSELIQITGSADPRRLDQLRTAIANAYTRGYEAGWRARERETAHASRLQHQDAG